MLHADPTAQSPAPAQSWRHRPLPWLLLGSMALHALVLAWQPPASPLRLAEPAGHSAPLGLQLASTADAPQKAPARTTTPSSPESESEPQPASPTSAATPEPADSAPARNQQGRSIPAQRTATATSAPSAPAEPAEPESSAAPAPRPVSTAAAPAPHPQPRTQAQPSAPADSGQRSAVLSEIRDALQRHFFYPRLARLRNWEGNVLLGFQVHSDGRIEDVQVLESSGRAVLDQAAMRALRSVRQVAYNSHRPVDLQLPVAYRLH